MTLQIIIDDIITQLNKIFETLDYPKISFNVEPAKKGFGDITCNAPFLLAKTLKQRPQEISIKIADEFNKNPGKFVSKAVSHKTGYLNIFLNYANAVELIVKNSIKREHGYVNIGNGTNIVIEHTSVNPNKALHIGHVRNVVIGDTLARILEKTDHQVSILNYVDDSGLQVADIVIGFQNLGFSQNPPGGMKFDHYCGDEVYVKTTEKYLTNPELEDTRKSILKEIEQGNSETARFAADLTNKVLECQLETCWRLGASYDCLNFESQIISSGLWELIFEKLKKLHLIDFEIEGKNQGCWVIRGNEKEEDKVLVRSNGTATYIAKDIPYAAWKLGLVDDPFYYQRYPKSQQQNRVLWRTTLEKSSKKNFSGEKVITVIDSRQSRLQKIITSLMAKFKSSPDAYSHLGYESVTLSSDTAHQLGLDTKGKQTQMSGRKGIYVNADSVLDLLEKKIISETRKRNPDFDSETLATIGKDVAVGTIRYEMIKQDLEKIITFDLTKSLSLEGDTASYLQYTYARAARILEKANNPPNFDTSFELILDENEKNLVKLIGMFVIHVRDASRNLSPKVIAKFCYDLSVAFNVFYEHVKVLNLPDKKLENCRLCLVYSFSKTMDNALSLLGINAPTRM